MRALTRASTNKLARQETQEISSADLLTVVKTGRAKGTVAPPEPFGPYLVYEELGVGGMASVHRAETKGIAGFRKPIALKRMLPHVASDAQSVQSFLEEGKLASHLHHPNIAHALDLGKIGDTYYIAMELVPGPTLKQILVQANSASGAIPVPIVVEILIQLCDALDHAHNLCDDAGRPLGIIHRDVSPTNVIVSSAGVVKLIDFGIAKAASSLVQTQAGLVKGKFGYVAPEYLLGHLDARADLFALGVVAHELLTGQRLFVGGSDFATVCAVRDQPIARPSRKNPQVSVELDDIVMTALQRDPDQRWQHARAMRVALAGVARDLGAFIGGQQIRDYAEWAFMRQPRSSTNIVKLVDALETDFRSERTAAESPVARPLAKPLIAKPLIVKPPGVSHPGAKTLLIEPPVAPRSVAVRPSGTDDIRAIRVSYHAIQLRIDPCDPHDLDTIVPSGLDAILPRKLAATVVHKGVRAATQMVARPKPRVVSPWLIMLLLMTIAGALVLQGWISLDAAPALARL